MLGAKLGGGGKFESSKVELLLKMLLKAWHFSDGEAAMDWLGKIKGGINELEKLLEIETRFYYYLIQKEQRIFFG